MARAKAMVEGEADRYPEADRFADFPHPRETFEVLGQDAAERTLAQAFESGRMPHAWLLTGPDGVGKASLAFAFSRYALGRGAREEAGNSGSLAVPEDDPVISQINALSHPNLLVLRRQWNIKDKRFYSAILVDDVRRLQSFFGLTAGEDRWRIVIVDKADDLNENAANALLKSLEEPPARSLFFLISSTPGQVLTTIRSRCRKLALRPLATGDLVSAVQNACHEAGIDAPTGENLERLTALAEGSVRRALELHTGNGLELYEALLGIFNLLPKLDLKQVDALAERLGPPSADADFGMFFSLLTDMLYRLVRQGAEGSAKVADEAEIARRLMPPHSLAKWAELWETVGQAQRQAQALNLDRKILILETLQGLRKTALSSRT